MKEPLNLADNYTELYDCASDIPQQGDNAEVDFFASLPTSDAGSRVLDIGCAEGRLAIALAKRGYKVTGVDISGNFVETARRNATEEDVHIDTHVVDIQQGIGNLAVAQFKTVFLMDIVEHVPNPLKTLRNVRELLSADGELIINTPNAFALHRILWYLRRPRGLMNYFTPERLKDLHLQTYDYLTMEKTLNFAGLRVAKLIANRMTLPLTWSMKTIDPIKRALSRLLPVFSDDLLLRVRKCDPIDIEAQLEYWRQEAK